MTARRCRVSGCRYADTHTTAWHTCGTCGASGHGQMECGRVAACAELRRFVNDVLPPSQQCSLCGECAFHTTEAHRCTVCSLHGHQCPTTEELECATSNDELECPTCRVRSAVEWRPVFTGTSCAVCYEDGPKVIFSSCGHANVCPKCAQRLRETR